MSRLVGGSVKRAIRISGSDLAVGDLLDSGSAVAFLVLLAATAGAGSITGDLRALDNRDGRLLSGLGRRLLRRGGGQTFHELVDMMLDKGPPDLRVRYVDPGFQHRHYHGLRWTPVLRVQTRGHNLLAQIVDHPGQSLSLSQKTLRPQPVQKGLGHRRDLQQQLARGQQLPRQNLQQELSQQGLVPRTGRRVKVAEGIANQLLDNMGGVGKQLGRQAGGNGRSQKTAGQEAGPTRIRIFFPLLPLPVAGLMSDEPIEQVRDRMKTLIGAARSLRSSLRDPFAVMSFLGLEVIPSLKITDLGLVEVDAQRIVPLFMTD